MRFKALRVCEILKKYRYQTTTLKHMDEEKRDRIILHILMDKYISPIGYERNFFGQLRPQENKEILDVICGYFNGDFAITQFNAEAPKYYNDLRPEYKVRFKMYEIGFVVREKLDNKFNQGPETLDDLMNSSGYSYRALALKYDMKPGKFRYWKNRKLWELPDDIKHIIKETFYLSDEQLD